MAANYKSYSAQAKRFVRATMADRIEAACVLTANAVKENISESAPPASEPGDFPHVETGHLRRSVSHEMDRENLVGRVGTNVRYGKFLEIGTWKMAARPWLRPTMEKMKDIIAALLGRK